MSRRTRRLFQWRPLRPLLLALCGLVVLGVLGLSTAVAATFTISGNVTPSSVAPGASASISITVTSSSNTTAFIFVQVLNPQGQPVFQQIFNNQALPAGQPRTVSTTWQVPASEVAGTHSVSVRVFDLTNGSLQTNSNAARFTVTGRSQATATPTPTPRPTATPSGGATATPTATATGTPTATATISPTPLATSVSLPTRRISTDPYTNTTSQHRTQVEPYVFAFGSTIIATFQSGRFFDGGSSNVGWATSTNAGGSWRMGFLPGTTRFATPPGPFDRVSDPAVAYDAAHGTWLISTLALTGTNGAAVLAHRSADGVTWSNPVTVAAFGNLDKEWIACDTTSSSPFFGRCYVEWDDHSNGNLIFMSTSTDGGRTWSAPRNTADGATGLGGQPVVQPNGTVIVPIADAFVGSVLAFRSTDGGLTWGSTVTVAPITDHGVAGGLRSEPLPSAEIDGGGNVYVAWHDCRFVANCTANDIVMATSSDGLNWSGVSRIPIDGLQSGVDHFIPGLGVDRSTSGGAAHLGLTYYYYPQANCTSSTCQLSAGFVSSSNGGQSWTAPVQLGNAMSLNWLANTSQGTMVGDYIATAFSGGSAHPIVALANAPNGGLLDEATYAAASTLAGLAAAAPLAEANAPPVLSTAPDHPRRSAPAIRR